MGKLAQNWPCLFGFHVFVGSPVLPQAMTFCHILPPVRWRSCEKSPEFFLAMHVNRLHTGEDPKRLERQEEQKMMRNGYRHGQIQR